jgi:glyoxylase-like metal-dependent hydrolase (beta-lactamase superfamily II)
VSLFAAPDRVTEVRGDWDGRVRCFRAQDEVDTFGITTERHLVLVDTMATPALMRQVLALALPERGDRAVVVVNTHTHFDHAWGNQLFTRNGGEHPAPIVGHLAGPALMRAGGDFPLERMRREHPGRYDEVRFVPPDVTFAGRLGLDGGDLTIELLEAPGHSDDHVAVWIPELRLLFTGDAVEDPFPHVDSAAGLAEERRTLERLAALEPALVLPCHGDAAGPELIERNAALFDALVEDPGLTYDEALDRSHADPAMTLDLYRWFFDDAVAAARALRAA